MRGQVYLIEDKKFFVMGGARSVDKVYRKEHVSWWKEELPSMNEINEAIDNLDKHLWCVDYVITHCAPDNIQYRISPYFEHDIATNFLFSVNKSLEFKHWYFGHYHEDKDIDEKHTALYQKIIKIGEGVN